MRRIIQLALFLLLAAIPVSAQSGFTQVTAVVEDANGTLYSGGTYSVSFVNPGTPAGTQALLNGSTFQTVYAGLVIDAFGNLSIALPDNNVIATSSGALGTQWAISICSAQYTNPNQKYCFTYTTTITGASMNLTSALTAAAPLLPITGGGGGTLTATHVGYGSATNQLTGTTAFTYIPGTGTLNVPRVVLGASTTSLSSLNMPSGSAPSAPVGGDLWNQSGILKFYDGAHTNSLVTIQTAPTNGHLALFSGTSGLLMDGGSPTSGTVVNVNGVADNLTCTSPTTTPTCGFASTYVVVPVLTSGMKAGTTDAYAAIQAAITTAIANGGEVYVPEGNYKTSAGLTAPSANFRMRGAGSQVNAGQSETSITASASGYNTLTIGPGTVNSENPSGYLRDIALFGSGVPGSPTGISAFQLNGIIQFATYNVTLGATDICIDLINNDFGSQFENIRVYSGSCNVSAYLRTGSQSGSDLSFYNMWFGAPVWIAGGGGGYHFWGGQIGSNYGSINDNIGSVVMSKDYLTGATGTSSADFHGTSFESTNNTWVFRAFGTADLSLYNTSMNSTNSGAPALGVYKNTQYGCGQVAFHDTALGGFFTNSASGSPLIVISNVGSSPAGNYPCGNLIDEGTYVSGVGLHINGSVAWVNNMFVQSGINGYSTVINPLGVTLEGLASPYGGLLLSHDGNGTLRTSTNNNSTVTIVPTIHGTITPGDCTGWFSVTQVQDAGACGSGGAFAGGLGATYQDVTEIAAPTAPASGNDRLYLNSSTHLLSCLTSASANCMPSTSASSITVGTTTVAGGTSTNLLYNNAGVLGNEAVSSLAIGYGQLPSLSANQVLGALTSTTPSGLSIPSCSGAANALTWTSGTGYGCNTITSGGTATSVGLQINGGASSGIFGVSGSPVTTSGNLNYNLTGTSGGISYFSTTAVLSSSALLPSGDFVLGGGAGSAPTASFSVVPSVNGGTGVASPTAHDMPVAEGASNYTFISPSTSGFCLTSNGTSADPSFQSCPGSGGPGTGTQFAVADWATTSTLGSVLGAVTGQSLIANNAAAPTFASPGVQDSVNSPVTSGTYPIAADTSTTLVDRVHTIRFKSGTAGCTIPQTSTSGVGVGFTTALIDDGAGPMTCSRSGSDTFTVVNGSVNIDGATSFNLTNGAFATLNAAASGLWIVRLNPAPGSASTGVPALNSARWAAMIATPSSMSGLGIDFNELNNTARTLSTISPNKPTRATYQSTTGGLSGVYSGPAIQVQASPLFQSWASTTTTTLRFWNGLYEGSAASTESDAPSSSGAMFRYSSIAGDSNYQCYTSNGSGGTTLVDSGVAASSGAGHYFQIQINSGASAVFSIDGATVCTITTNLPAPTGGTALRAMALVSSTSSLTITEEVGWFYVVSSF